MKRLDENESIEQIIKFIESKKSSDELCIDYYRKNKVLSDYKKINNVELTISNELNLSFEIFSIDFYNLFIKAKNQYLKLNPKSKIINLEIDFEDEGYAIIDGLSISLSDGIDLKTIIGIDNQAGEFYSSVFISKYSKKDHFIENKEKAVLDLWLEQDVKEKNEFLTKEIAIPISKINEEITLKMLKNFFIDCDKDIIQSNDIIPLLKINDETSYIKTLLNTNTLLNYESFKKGYTIPKNETGIIYLYNFSNLYLTCLNKDIENHIKGKNYYFLKTCRKSINTISIEINNEYYNRLFKTNYKLFIDYNNKIFLYSNEKLIWQATYSNGEAIPEILLSFIENDVKNNLMKKICRKSLSDICNEIKNNISNKSIQIKIPINKEIFANKDDKTIQIIIEYENNELVCLYNKNNLLQVNSEVDSWISSIVLSNIFSESNTKHVKRL